MGSPIRVLEAEAYSTGHTCNRSSSDLRQLQAHPRKRQVDDLLKRKREERGDEQNIALVY